MNRPAYFFSFPAVLYCLVFIAGCIQNSPESFISVNLVGYDSYSSKQAFLVNAEAERFEVIRVEDENVAYSGPLQTTIELDSATGDQLTIIDFSDFNIPGEYKIKTAGTPPVISHTFSIKENPYDEALQTILKSYYYHRCGIQVRGDQEWKYETCHLADAPFFDNSQQFKEVTGGWHDAGDYNKFSGNTALSAGLLLYAYEHNPSIFGDNQLQIPESGNGTPDILDEISWAMKWLLKMQRSDGAVYHKVSQKRWIGEYLPNTDPSIRYIFGISTAATASFTASSALGSRILADFNPELAQRLSGAAKNAWEFLDRNPQNYPVNGFKNPEGVTGGEYGDPSDLDERLWAAIELYKLTADERYLNYFTRHYIELDLYNIPPISWRDANSLALNAFLSADIPDRFLGDRNRIETAVIRHADHILDIQNLNGYKNLLHDSQYYWGSNSVGLAYAFDLIQAYNITGNYDYKNSALDQLHYVFGRNPFNLSQVTGVGTAAVKHPYHQLSEVGSFSKPVPGMLVGGPNSHLLLNDKVISDYPAKSYEDKFKNYLVNEPAINFTAILAYVTSVFSGSEAPISKQT